MHEGDIRADIFRNIANKISYVRINEKWILLKGAKWWLKGHLMAPFSVHGISSYDYWKIDIFHQSDS